jgi:hypothetical protein
MKTWLLPVAALAAASLACDININTPNVRRVQTGPEQTITVDEPAAAGESGSLELQMGAGTLDLRGGAEGLVSGEIRTNIEEWVPTITRNGDSVTISQRNSEGAFPTGDDVINRWDLTLGDTPLDLTVRAGAYSSNIDLGGVPLRSLNIDDGASSSTVTFSAANPETMSRLDYDTGASTVTLTGLANANAERILFSGGAGTFTLDFTDGELQRDVDVDIHVGVCTLTVIVPDGTPVTVTTDNALASTDTDGNWGVNGDIYTTSGSGPAITINIDMGVGSLNLITQ